MKFIEHFYSGDSIDAAYKSVNKPGSSSGAAGAAAAKKANSAKSTKQNLWEFLGLNNMNEKQMACSFDCSIKGADCLEKCQKNNNKDESCTYKCSSNGLKCMKKCILPPKPKPKPTTSISKKKNDEEEYENVNGVDKGNVDYAPYKSNLWPQFSTNIGWNTDKIEEHNDSNGSDQIEVSVKNYYPFVKTYEKDKKDKKDKKVFETNLLREIRWNPHILEDKSIEYTDNKEFMKKAVSANWQALQYASKKLRGDKDIVYIAVKQNWVALQYVDEKLKPDIEWKNK